MTMSVNVSARQLSHPLRLLTVLQSFPGDALKIDRSFIGTMHEDEDHHAIVRGIVALAHNLGMHVVAEGIEHPAQLALLRSIGCEYGQGYLFARPMAAVELEPAIVAGDVERFAVADLCVEPPPRCRAAAERLREALPNVEATHQILVAGAISAHPPAPVGCPHHSPTLGALTTT